MMNLDFASEKLLDATGWKLLAELQADARLSLAELGRRVGLTPPGVADRLRRLEEAGIITGYRVEIDAAKLGLPLTAFVRFTSTQQDYAAVDAVISSLPEVLECHRVTGTDCYIMKVVVSSVGHLESLINRLTPYGSLISSIVLSSLVKRRALENTLRDDRG